MVAASGLSRNEARAVRCERMYCAPHSFCCESVSRETLQKKNGPKAASVSRETLFDFLY